MTEREQIARLLCEQHGGDPEAVATEEHDSWEGPLWTVFVEDANAIIALRPTLEDGVVAADVWKVLQNPNALHLNMLRGGVAMPSPAQIWHIYGAALAEAMPDDFRAMIAASPNDETVGQPVKGRYP
jgi:hypothetical protein